LSWKSLSSEARTFLIARGLSAFSLGIAAILLNLYFRAVGFDEKFMGMSFAIFGLGCAVFSIPVGYLSDYVGSLTIMVIGEVILCFTLWGQIFSLSPAWILFSSLVAGIGAAFIAVARQPYTAKVSKTTDKVSLFSFSYAIFLGMTVVGNLSGGLARHLVPSLTIAISYRSLLFVAGILNLLSAAILFYSRKGAKPVLSDFESFTGEKLPGTKGTEDVSGLWSNVIKLGTIQFIIGLGSGISIPFLNIYFKDRFDLSTMSIGGIFAIGSLITAVIVMAGPRLAGRTGTVKAIVVLQLISLPFLLLLSFPQFLGLAILAFWLRGALMKTATPLFRSVVMNTVPQYFRGRAASVTVTLWHLGHSAGSLVGGKLISDSGFFTPFVSTAVIYAGAAILFYILFKNTEQGIVAKDTAVIVN
jgi:MFS family permease